MPSVVLSKVATGCIRLIAQELAQDLFERGGIDIREAFIDGIFVSGRKGGLAIGGKIYQDSEKERHNR